MAKFYVQSGTLKMLVQAESSDRAALWAVHRAMQQVLPLYDDQTISPEDKTRYALVEGWMSLADEIRLSEMGFDREDADRAQTMDVVLEWNQLMLALAKLESCLLQAT